MSNHQDNLVFYMCAIRKCKGSIVPKITQKEISIYICGIPQDVCNKCKASGYSCQSGMGDGKTYIYNGETLVDRY